MTIKDYDSWDKSRLIAEIEKLSNRKKYGLVWEEKSDAVVDQCKTELPVLEEISDRLLETDSSLPTNFIIEGDNYHALSVLNYTHAGQVDVIYIDPPYNTGNNSWRYNNNYINTDDPYRHSKWISMMEQRLRLSKTLLKDDGVIIVTIDDYELYNLGLLMDQIFGEERRMGVVAVEINPRGRTTNRHFATSHEYILFYGRSDKAEIFDLELTDEQTANFRFEDAESLYRLLPFRRSGGLSTPADRPNSEFFIGYNPRLKKIVSIGGARTTEAKDAYKTNEVYFVTEGSIKKATYSSYTKQNQDVVEIYPVDSKGKRRVWRWSDRKKILLHATQGDFVVKDVKDVYSIYLKDRLKTGRKPKTVWIDSKFDASTHGTNLLKRIFKGEKVFDYPKSLHAVIHTLLVSKARKKESLIVDFFAGSGTTGHAVMELNKADGGQRRFILCTNNENDIAEEVTYPRIKNVVEGYGDSEGIPANLRYFKTTFVKKSDVSDDTRRELISRSTEMLCVKESTFKKAFDNKKFKIYHNDSQATGVLFDLDALEEFKERLAQVGLRSNVYVFSLTSDAFLEDFSDLDVAYKIQPIPEGILEVYRKIFS
ncbi:TPA: hypothetical protein DEP26_04200 [Candidatus Uhrbacteria bacterium]|nr:hypothetical protein [Candidatus Uhrbacteria bacterium]